MITHSLFLSLTPTQASLYRRRDEEGVAGFCPGRRVTGWRRV